MILPCDSRSLQPTSRLKFCNIYVAQSKAPPRFKEIYIDESESRLQRIVNGTADGILVLNREGVVLFSNSSAAAMMGHPTEQLLGLDLRLPLNITDTHEIQVLSSYRFPPRSTGKRRTSFPPPALES